MCGALVSVELPANALPPRPTRSHCRLSASVRTGASYLAHPGLSLLAASQRSELQMLPREFA